MDVSLPAETLHAIFELVAHDPAETPRARQRSLASLASSSRTFKAIATQLLYESPVVVGSKTASAFARTYGAFRDGSWGPARGREELRRDMMPTKLSFEETFRHHLPPTHYPFYEESWERGRCSTCRLLCQSSGSKLDSFLPIRTLASLQLYTSLTSLSFHRTAVPDQIFAHLLEPGSLLRTQLKELVLSEVCIFDAAFAWVFLQLQDEVIPNQDEMPALMDDEELENMIERSTDSLDGAILDPYSDWDALLALWDRLTAEAAVDYEAFRNGAWFAFVMTEIVFATSLSFSDHCGSPFSALTHLTLSLRPFDWLIGQSPESLRFFVPSFPRLKTLKITTHDGEEFWVDSRRWQCLRRSITGPFLVPRQPATPGGDRAPDGIILQPKGGSDDMEAYGPLSTRELEEFEDDEDAPSWIGLQLEVLDLFEALVKLMIW